MAPVRSSARGKSPGVGTGGSARRSRSRSRNRSRSTSRGRGSSKRRGRGIRRPVSRAMSVQPARIVDIKARAAASHLKLIHISKCAGTALENWGFNHGFSWGKRWTAIGQARKVGLHPPHEGRMKSAPWHVPPRFFVESPYRGFANFTVVRNPYARVISEFRCPWVGFMAPVRGSRDRRKKRKLATQAQLNSWIREKLSKGVARPPFTNGHWIPQCLYVSTCDGKRCVAKGDVIRFESLADGIAALLRRHGLPDFPCIAMAKTNVSEMPSFDVEHLDGATRRLIEEAYAEDFKQFRYEFLPSGG